jgi:hypothetical protein
MNLQLFTHNEVCVVLENSSQFLKDVHFDLIVYIDAWLEEFPMDNFSLHYNDDVFFCK